MYGVGRDSEKLEARNPRPVGSEAWSSHWKPFILLAGVNKLNVAGLRQRYEGDKRAEMCFWF